MLAVCLAVGTCLGTAAVAVAAPLAQHPRYATLVEAWRAQMDLFDVPGAAIAVVENDRTWIETTGVRNESGDPVTADTIFYIASITKTYVATLAAMLAEAGELSLDDGVRTHLPRFDLASDDAETTITVRDLLAHRPGITSEPIVLLDAYTGEITEDRYYYWLSRVTPPGKTRYENVHYTLVGRIIESVTGSDWRDALEARLFRPAGLDRTTGYASRMYGDEDSATPLERNGEAWKPVAQRKTDRTMHAAGGLGTTIEDAARYLRLHLDGGRIGDTRIFSEETAKEIQRETSSHEPDGTLRIMTGFGLGWQRGTFNGVPFLAHAGGYDGANAYMAFFPEKHVGLAILINAGRFAGAWGNAIAVDVFEVVTGTEAEWKPWERYTAQIQKTKAEQAGNAVAAASEGGAPVAAEAPAVSVPQLSRPGGQYEGAFRSQWLGTLHVSRTDGRMQLRLGDRILEHEPAGADALTLTDVTEKPAQLTFVVGAHGRVDRVRIVAEDWGEMVFER